MMIKYKLGNIVDVVSEREDNPSNCKYDKFVGLEHFNSGEVEIKNYGTTNLLKSSMKIFNAGDILIARRNVYLKRASVVNFDGITSGDSIVLRAKDELIKRLLPFVLNTDDFWDYADKFSDGTMSKRLSPKILLEYEFSLPDIHEQEKLAELLWTSNETKEAYKKLLALTDDLIEAQFVEMFGDPTNNPMGWEMIELGSCLTSIDSGKSLNCESYARTDKSPAILKLSAVTYGFYQAYENKVLPDPNMFIERAEVRDGDLLFSRKNTYEYVGMSAYVYKTPEKLMLPDLIFRLNTDDRCNRIYLWRLINHALFRKNVSELANGTASSMPNISKQKLSNLIIPLPPLNLQEQFAALVQQIDNSKLALQQTISNLEDTIKHLMKQNIG